MTSQATGTGTKDDPWQLRTPPGSSEYTMYRDETADPPALVCQVGSTQLRYHLSAIDDLHAMLKEHGDWLPLGGADEQKPAAEGTVEAWGRVVRQPGRRLVRAEEGTARPLRRLPPPAARGTRPGRADTRRPQQPHAGALTPRTAPGHVGLEPVEHRSADELAAGLDEIRRSPTDRGTVELIVRRPAEDEREELDEGALDLEEGLVGDMWRRRGSSRMPDGSANPEAQVTLMNARAIELIAGGRERWPLAGDQLYVDFHLGVDNLPAGARLAVGSAVLEITAEPHTGCAKFSARFGSEALRFVNGAAGRPLRLRGVNARVVAAGHRGSRRHDHQALGKGRAHCPP